MCNNIFTVKTKQGTFMVDTETGECWNGAALKAAVKACFDYWLENEAGPDQYEQYNGRFEEMDGGSYLDWRGAVEEGIEAVMDYIKENRCDLTSGDFLGKVDITAVFEP